MYAVGSRRYRRRSEPCCRLWLPQRSRRMSKPTSGNGIQERPILGCIKGFHARGHPTKTRSVAIIASNYLPCIYCPSDQLVFEPFFYATCDMQACGRSPAGSKMASNPPSHCLHRPRLSLDSNMLHRVQANLRHFEQVCELEGS
jgi:hypothetical protein